MTSNKLKMKICNSNAEVFSNSVINDVLLYNTNTSKSILIGTENSSTNLKISNNNITVSGNLDVTGTISGDGQNLTNLSTCNITGVLPLSRGGTGISNATVTGTGSLVLSRSPNLEGVVTLGTAGYIQLYNCLNATFENTSTPRTIFIQNHSSIGTAATGIITVNPNTTLDNTVGAMIYGWSSNASVLPYSEVLRMTRLNRVGINNSNPQYTLDVTGSINASTTVYANSIALTSDDRLKINEELIESALPNIMKLKPQLYNKLNVFEKIYDIESNILIPNSNIDNSQTIREAGLIAQEVFYEIPEWRHLIEVASDHDPIIYSSNIDSSINLSEDPIDYYKYWGSETARLNYTGLIAYLVRAIQELKIIVDNIENKN